MTFRSLRHLCGLASTLMMLAFPSFAASAQAQDDPVEQLEIFDQVYWGLGGDASIVAGSFGGTSFHDFFGPGGGFQMWGGSTLWGPLSGQITLAMDFYSGDTASLIVAWHTADLKLNPWRTEKLSPYLIGGIGGALFGLDPKGTAQGNTKASFTFTAAAGIDYAVSRRVNISPEIRIRYLFNDAYDLNAVPVNFSLNASLLFE